jgi:hypothetical protein
MAFDQLANPALLAVLAILGLGFVRLGIWWTVLRVLLAPLLRPLGLILVGAAAVAAALHLGG